MGARAILFDLDGTLLRLPVDIDAIRGELSALARSWGVESSFKPLLPELTSLRTRLSACMPEAEAADRAARAWSVFDEMEARDARGATLRRGAAELVEAVLAHGWEVALVTNNGRRAAEAALEAVGLPWRRFSAVVCRGEAASPKPSEAPLLMALGALGEVQTLWCVGDAPTDVFAARALRLALGGAPPWVQIVAVSGGLAPLPGLVAAAPDLVIAEPIELLPHLELELRPQ